MKKYHTIIIGAGPGGLTCATRLAERGREVLLLEKNNRIGPKVCAGGITWSGLIRYVPETLIEKSFTRQYISTAWQKAVISSSQPMVATVNREKLGQWMLAGALAAGVNIKTGCRVLEIAPPYVVTTEGKFAYQYLVGADGSNSLVRRFLRLACHKLGVGVHYIVPGEFERMEWHLDARLFTSGYAWIFPHQDHASIGAYAGKNGLRPRILLEKFHHWTQKHGIKLGDSRLEASLINFDFRGWRFADNIYLVGDAAGLASGLTGEGIYPAIVSGEAAALSICGSQQEDQRLASLINNHRKHCRLQQLISRNGLACRVIMELLIGALRTRMLDFNALEMGN